MIQKSDLLTIEEEVRRLNRDFSDPNDEDTFRTSVVVITAALGKSTDVNDLAELTGYPREFIAAITERMHVARLWEEGHVHDKHWWVDDLFEQIQLVGFWMDVPVAKGCVVAMQMADGQFRYRTAEFGPRPGEDVILHLEFANTRSAGCYVKPVSRIMVLIVLPQ